MYKTYKSIFLQYVPDKNISKPDVVSYGIKKGSYLTNEYTLTKYALDKNYNSIYCFVPIKTEFYTLIWDLDFKIDKCLLLNQYVNQFNFFIQFIISSIIQTINNIFINPNTEYIYCDKNIGYGIHLYFPNIIVNKFIHSYIYNITKDNMIKKNIIPIELINHILDPCVSNSNGLRLFYYFYNNTFYKPNQELSTFIFDEKPENHFKFCLINTNDNNFSPKLKINYDDIHNNIFNIKNNNNNTITDNIEYINDFTFLKLDDKHKLFIELSNSFSIERLNDYNKWINVVYLFKTYGLYDEIINLSKKSNKYDINSFNIINNIFKKKRIPKSFLTIGSLIKWCSDDDFNNTVKILEKYDIKLKLNINDINDILLTHSKNKINFSENSNYISKNAIDNIIHNINSDLYNTFLIQSPTGTGKTTALNNILKSINNDYTILCIVTRRSMCSTLINAFNFSKDLHGNLIKNNHFNFISYMDEHIYNDNHFISSLENLFVFKQFYDVIILDEIFSLCNYLYSDTLIGRRKDCLLHLKNLIINAKLIIGCDAQIADICFQLFNDKNIYFYKNTFKNKIDIPFNIFNSKHSSDNSNLTKIASIIGNKYCIYNKSVIIFSDRKNTTVKLMELLKIYNNNPNYFRVFNSNCGTIDDINNIDTISKNRCIISSPKIIYGVDITTKYDDVFCIYSKAKGTNSMSSFEWYQQLSRARYCKAVNVFILDSNHHKFYNSFISFDKNKSEEDIHINNYIYYKKSIYEKYNLITEITSINTYFRNIHYYKSWYDKLFSNNKLQILKLLAIQIGYNISENDFDSIKIKSDLDYKVKLNYKLQTEISFKIINNQYIDEQYNFFLPNLKEIIKFRGKYINKDNPNYINLLSDEKLFNSFINKKILDLSKNDFLLKNIKINSQEFPEIMKDNVIFNQINTLFWIEELLNIKRYDVNNIDKNINIDFIKKQFLNNLNKFICFYVYEQSKNKTINRITNIINKINTYNKLQKFYVDLIHVISPDIFNITIKKYNYRNVEFLFFKKT